MSFRKILLGLLTLWLALMGIVFGALFVICAGIYLLWHGLSMSAIAFGGLCVVFIALAMALASVALRRVKVKDRIGLSEADPAEIAESGAHFFSDSASESRRGRSDRHKMV